MKAFCALFRELDASSGTEHKVSAMARYLQQAAPDDAAWAVYFLAGGKPRQVVPAALLRQTASAAAQLPDWLFEASYAAVGDLAETISYLLPPPVSQQTRSLAQWLQERIGPLRGLDPDEQSQRIREDWATLSAEERFIYVKLIGGGFRVGVSRLLVQRALAQAFGLDAQVVAHRMMGYTDAKVLPTPGRYLALVAPGTDPDRDGVRPYPFFLAHPLQDPVSTLGDRHDWQVEWKWDGIRAQVLRRGTQCAIWSRGEELLSERFPEVMALAQGLPDGTVLDGELLVWLPDEPRPAAFAQLQKRITRKTLSSRLLRELPVRFMAYDLLEHQGDDLRERPLRDRRKALQELADAHALGISEPVQAGSWDELTRLRDESRARGVEGFMLKRLDSAYGSGRTKLGGGWWKWKIDPMRVDAILLYAQAGHGRRANVYTDYTFAVWNRSPADAAEVSQVLEDIRQRKPPVAGGLQLVPFAKAYSGLTDAEFQRVDHIVRSHTVDSYGPVRSVVPSLVFELGFEAISRSTRHKSGVATRFPRMLRIRDDKPLLEAETLQGLLALLGE